MKRVALVTLVFGFAAPRVRADAVDDLVSKGETLARSGKYSQAIVEFKAADKLHSRAKHACMIGLAYVRRELWPQAELFLERCKQRVTPDDPLPAWFHDAEQLLAQRLAGADVAAVSFVIVPTDAKATISVSSFAPDETFAPRMIHIAPGKHVIEVSAPGFVTQSQAITISGREPVSIAFNLDRTGGHREPRSWAPIYVVGGGVALGLAASIYYVAAAKPLRDELATTLDKTVYDHDRHLFIVRRDTSIGLGVAAAATAAIGLVLHYTVFNRETTVRVSAQLGGEGAVVIVGWER